MNVFFDMDGVLAQYERTAYEKPDFLWKKPDYHYFSTVKPDQKAIDLFNLCQKEPNTNAFILTSVLNNGPICLEQIMDKMAWIQKHIPNTDLKKQFIPSVSIKTRTIQAMLFQNKNNIYPSDILIDDYNPNLKAWQDAGGTAMKYLNGLNHADSWRGIVLTENMTAEDICELISVLGKTALFANYN